MCPLRTLVLECGDEIAAFCERGARKHIESDRLNLRLLYTLRFRGVHAGTSRSPPKAVTASPHSISPPVSSLISRAEVQRRDKSARHWVVSRMVDAALFPMTNDASGASQMTNDRPAGPTSQRASDLYSTSSSQRGSSWKMSPLSKTLTPSPAAISRDS